MSESSPLKPASLALDFGHLSTIVAIVPHEESDKCVLVRNMDMNVETPSCVAFTPELRLFGLTAQHGARSRENTAFEQLPLWLRAGAAAPDAITMREEEQQFSADELVAMFIAHVRTFSEAFATERGWAVRRVVFALPESMGDAARARLLEAACMAGWSNARSMSSIDALASAFARKSSGAEAQHFCVLDCGAMQMSAAIGRAEAVAEMGNGGAFSVLSRHAVAGTEALCGTALNALLFDHFAAIFVSKRDGAALSARLTSRLRERCQKLREQLSAGTRSSLVLDGIEPPLAPIAFSRDDFERLCAPAKASLVAALRALLASSGLAAADLASIVLVGGVTRTPWVQAAVASVFERDVAELRFTLDVGYAVATGAAQHDVISSSSSSAVPPVLPTEGGDASPVGAAVLVAAAAATPAASAAAVAAFGALEATLRTADAEAQRAAELRYKLDSYVVSIRSECDDGAHAALLPTDLIAPLLDAAEEWAYEPRSAADCESKLASLEAELRATAPAWFSTREAERLALEAELQASQEAERLAQEAEGGAGDDHDRRNLSFTRRMELVTKNKAEATELWGGKNYDAALRRYTKALAHCGRFVGEPTMDQVAAIKAAELGLYLNLAMVWEKKKEWQKVLNNTSKALALDPVHIKGLYRRAYALFQLKKYDDARDAMKALEKSNGGAPSKSKPVVVLKKHIEHKIAQQKKKQAKMAKRMFS